MPPLAKLGFLVLEDNPNMVTIIRLILKGFGADKIYDANTISDAFDLTRRHHVDIALIDCNLGAADGINFVKLIRTAADSPAPYMPLIMISAYSEQSRVKSARDAGATDFMAKPVTPIELYRKIIDVVERPRHFIRSADFFGPDRRRRDDEAYEGPERRAAAVSAGAVALADVE